MSLKPTLLMSFELTSVLADMERTGWCIDTEALGVIEKDYTDELGVLKPRLQEIIREVMGDTPINLDSGDDLSKLLYSRSVKDKRAWAAKFNLGTEWRGASRKPKRRAEYRKKVFRTLVVQMTDVMHKTDACRCVKCSGKGHTYPTKKDGTSSKAKRVCRQCGGKGIEYVPSTKVAGLKLVPRTALDTCTSGFACNSDTLKAQAPNLTGVAQEFVTKFMRYNAIKTYLKTFVLGIKNELQGNMVYVGLNQTVVVTGRLSSRFHNMPRESTFPVRRAIVSRFEGGSIMVGDFAQLEFRVAGFLSTDPQVYRDIEEGVDVHERTAKIMKLEEVYDDFKQARQAAKADTFKPLYGGTTGSPRQMLYYQKFKDHYEGITAWHDRLAIEALTHRKITLPSGREYSFPNVRRTKWGSVTSITAIKNYPVQGFATGDLLPIALIGCHRRLQEAGCQSLIIYTQHDSIILDVHPDEVKIVLDILRESMLSLPLECRERYGIEYDMPVEIEVKVGPNWLEGKEVG